MKNKKVKAEQPILHHPIVFQQNSIVESKMEAISELSKAVYELSKALNGVNTTVNIEGNIISNSSSAGISIKS